ncbi:MAG: YidC/Oxa1 family membrane protein insertase [Treponema sp.]|jgi:YidC/Oxa1 family membrane protein insertase|nr:YidC/Oxa1 family membrane protein insertase [Treponema sp.]
MLNLLYNLIIFPLTQIIEFSFVFSLKVFKETGLSLIFVSIVVSVLCLPLYNVAEKWQETERNLQKRMKPKLDRIRAAFTGDSRYMTTSVYYQQNHYHPIYALRSSFGLLIQVPFFIAAYAYLSNLEALQGAQFFFISDLGLPDGLIHLGNVKVNFLPIFMTLLNLTSGAVYSRGFLLKDKLQIIVIALFFLVLLYNSPSALVIYWTMNNIFSLVKNVYYKIQFKHKNSALFAVFSSLCLFLVYYILALHKGDSGQRFFIAFAASLAALTPWLIRLVSKIKIPPKLKIFDAPDKRKIFPLFLLSFLVLSLLVGLYIPSILIVSSPVEFSFIDNYTTPNFFIFNTFTQSIGFFIVWPLALFFLFSSKTKYILAGLGVLLCTGAVLNTFAFSGDYGLISINMELSNGVGHSFDTIINNIISLGISAIIVLILLYFRFYKIIVPVLSICIAALVGMSSVNIFTISNDFAKLPPSHSNLQAEKVSTEPIFSLSKKGKNTVIIMLDRASSSFFPYILEESPELKEIFSGFTYYPNTVSFNGYTLVGAPPIFGGYEYTPEEINKRVEIPLRTKQNEALLLLPKLFSEAGYSVTVTDPPNPNYSNIIDFSIYEGYTGVQVYQTGGTYTKIWLDEHNLNLPSISAILKRNIFWYGLFRITPLVTRRGLYQYGDWCSSIPGQKLTVFIDSYAVLDYLPRLGEILDNDENTFLLMVNNTTHHGAFLQEPDYFPTLSVTSYFSGPYNKETEYHINIAAYKRLGDWFNFLRSHGVYDNTRIILVSDHGSQISYVTKAPPSMPSNFDNLHPILLVKDFNASGEIKTDMTFMTNADVPFLSLTGLIENLVNPFTGNPISTKNKEKPLYIAVSGSVHLGDPLQTQISLNPRWDYYVHGGIFEEKNWSRVEE